MLPVYTCFTSVFPLVLSILFEAWNENSLDFCLLAYFEAVWLGEEIQGYNQWSRHLHLGNCRTWEPVTSGPVMGERGVDAVLGQTLAKWYFTRDSHYPKLEAVSASLVQNTAHVLVTAVWMSVHLLLCRVAPKALWAAWDLCHRWVMGKRNCVWDYGDMLPT